MQWRAKTRVVLFTEHPFLAHGLAAVFERRNDFELIATYDDWLNLAPHLATEPTDVVLAHFGPAISLAGLRELKSADARVPVVLWGEAPSSEFLFHAIQLNVRGLVPPAASTDAVLTAIQRARNGELCFEGQLVESLLHRETVVLTPRETQLVTLVAQGLRNKEIAGALGLTEGTVKVYLTRIFRKLDLDDRLELALYGLKSFFAGATGEDQRGGNARGEITCPRSLPRRQRDPATPILVH